MTTIKEVAIGLIGMLCAENHEGDIYILQKNLSEKNIERMRSALKSYLHPSNINNKCRHGLTLLHHFVIVGDLESVKFLIFNGADLNIKDKKNETPLLTSAKYKHFEIAKFFLENGATEDSFSNEHLSVLHFAAESADLDFIKFLIKKGLNIEAKDANFQTPLFWIYGDDNAILKIKLFLENGANINLRDKNGDTPLHSFINRHDCYPPLEVVKFFLENGADINLRNKYKQTVIDLVRVEDSDFFYYDDERERFNLVRNYLLNYQELPPF